MVSRSTMFHLIFQHNRSQQYSSGNVQTWHRCQTHTIPYYAESTGIRQWAFDRTKDHHFSVSIPSTCLFFLLLFYEGRGGGSKSIAVMGMLECLLSVGKHSMSLVTKLCHWPDSPSLVLFTVNPVFQHATVFHCGLLCVCMYLPNVRTRLVINY